MNKVILIGRIGQDPKEFTFDNGDKKTSFSLATSSSYKDKNGEWIETTEWHNIVLNRETKLKKGDMISIDGKIKTRKYEKDGKDIYLTEIIAYATELLSRKEIPKEHTQQPEKESKPNEISNESDLPY